MSLRPTPAAVDWGLFAAVLLAAATGLLGLVTGRPSGAWVFVVHGIAGVALLVLLPVKLLRVARRLRPGRLTPTRGASAVLLVVAAAAVGTGVAWTLGVEATVARWTLLTVHGALGLATLALVGWHLRHRLRSPALLRREGRRTALTAIGATAVAGTLWWGQQAAATALALPGADRRFTGSREDGSGEGNAFPVTSWVADDPDPVAPGEWSLAVTGRVERDRTFAYGDLPGVEGDSGGTDESPLPAAARRATLDCTSGWYSGHRWQGVRVGDLLSAAGADEDARWVQFRSVTGYRYSLPFDEARDALLATHVDGERLSHGHGRPLRLVAPGRRGFQWVKWVERVEVRRTRDLGELVAIFTSGFDS